ncbi:uncharacterized protein [Drosophila tropicalis]|uniref:uncharacterized protein n=1 Tax=Drosophila tropicalis TaxID=46794 RepID=UPI0035AB7125
MSKRVSIVLPDELEIKSSEQFRRSLEKKTEKRNVLPELPAPEMLVNVRPEGSSQAAQRRVAKHPRSSKLNSHIGPETTATQDENRMRSSPRDSSSSKPQFASSLLPTFTLVSSDEPDSRKNSSVESNPMSDFTEPPNTSTDCAKFDKNCDCCHCSHMRQAEKQAEFLKSPEGQRRQEMKLMAKNFFMDLCAMSQMRKQILNELHGTKQKHPSSRVSYPVSLTNASILDSNSLAIKWFVHDHSDIDYYAIYVDDKLAKRVYNVKSKGTILIDLNPHEMHHLRISAVPHKGRGSKADPMDKMVKELCAGKMDNLRNGEYSCNCDNPTKATKAFYKKNHCKSLIDFWHDSEFLYMPPVSMPGYFGLRMLHARV